MSIKKKTRKHQVHVDSFTAAVARSRERVRRFRGLQLAVCQIMFLNARSEQRKRPFSRRTDRGRQLRRRAARGATEARTSGDENIAEELQYSASGGLSLSQHLDLHFSGPLKRHYGHLMNRVMRPLQSNISPIKPMKDNINK